MVHGVGLVHEVDEEVVQVAIQYEPKLIPVQPNQQHEQCGIVYEVIHKHGIERLGLLLMIQQQAIVPQQVLQHVDINVLMVIHGMERVV